jgi:hypothetical protein
MRITRMRVLAVLAALGLLALATGGALAVGKKAKVAAAAADEIINACRHPNGGWVRIVPAVGDCRSREQAVSWNVAGPAGPAGPPGPEGPRGDSGAGLTKLADLAGIECTSDGGDAGKVELDFAGDDTVLLRCVSGGTPPPPPPTPGLVINEVDYDQVGTDGDGFVELKNTGTSPIDLTGIALVFVDGADSEEYDREALTGSLDPGSFVVAAGDAQNGAPDGLALIDTDDGALLDALSYEGGVTGAAIEGRTYSLVEGTMLSADVADSNSTAGSLSRIPDGADTNDAASDWVFTTTLTRGAANVATAP